MAQNDSELEHEIDNILYGEHTQPYSTGDALLMLMKNYKDKAVEEAIKEQVRLALLDLIAEAKPNPDDYDDRQNFVADEFENNLIQAINGGKK